MTQRWALVTGASAGLGAEFARQLAADSKNIVLVARRGERLQTLASELQDSAGIETRTFVADLSEASAPFAIFDFVKDEGLHIDYLINNAGKGPPDLVHDRDWDEHRAYIELMLTSCVALCHLFIPPMRERGFGRIVNVASVAGLVSVAGDYSYGPIKAYLVSLSKSLQLTYRRDGIHVLAFCPGFTHTEFHDSELLARRKREIADFLWYDADVVVREGLQALEGGKPVQVSGRLYRIFVPLVNSRLGNWVLRVAGVRRGRE